MLLGRAFQNLDPVIMKDNIFPGNRQEYGKQISMVNNSGHPLQIMEGKKREGW